MANTTTATELVVTKFLADFFREYVRNNRFSRYTGTSSNNPIVIKEGRQTINVPLVGRLKNAGVSGNQTLRGNGEPLGNFGYDLIPTYIRHAVEMTKEEKEKPNIDLMRAAREQLMSWAMEVTRDDVIKAMLAMHNGTTYTEIAAASEAVADAWSANNDDRVLFGSTTANHSGDHSADLAKCDTTNDTLDRGMVSLARRMAEVADPHIRPIRTSEDEEWFVMFCDPFAFRDLKDDLANVHPDAQVRGNNNPLYRDGDQVWDGVICRKIPEIDAQVTANDGSNPEGGVINLLTGGASSARVGPNFLCGAQALGFGMGQRPDIIVDRDYDYGFQPGVAVEMKHDIDKLFYDNNASGTSSQHVQHGMVTVYAAAAAD